MCCDLGISTKLTLNDHLIIGFLWKAKGLNIVVDILAIFLQRAHSPDRPKLDSNPQPVDHKTRALIVALTSTIKLEN